MYTHSRVVPTSKTCTNIHGLYPHPEVVHKVIELNFIHNYVLYPHSRASPISKNSIHILPSHIKEFYKHAKKSTHIQNVNSHSAMSPTFMKSNPQGIFCLHSRSQSTPHICTHFHEVYPHQIRNTHPETVLQLTSIDSQEFYQHPRNQSTLKRYSYPRILATSVIYIHIRYSRYSTNIQEIFPHWKHICIQAF